MNTPDTKARFLIRARAIIVHEGKLLTVRHRATDTYVALPGGHLELGESPEACLVRELEEEFGVTATVGRLLYVHTLTQVRDSVDEHFCEFFFGVLNGADFMQTSVTATHAHEIAEVVWLAPDTHERLLPTTVLEDFARGDLPKEAVRFIHA